MCGVAEELRHADQTGDGAGEQHRDDDHPLDVDAAGDRRGLRLPVARRSKPKRVRLSTNQNATPSSTARTPASRSGARLARERRQPVEPRCPRGSSWCDACCRLVLAVAVAAGSRRGSRAIALSMIVEITSLTPRVTLSTPAMPAQSAPTAIATQDARRATLSKPGKPAPRRRTTAAANDAIAVLALDADVEQVHPEADGRGECRTR